MAAGNSAGISVAQFFSVDLDLSRGCSSFRRSAPGCSVRTFAAPFSAEYVNGPIDIDEIEFYFSTQGIGEHAFEASAPVLIDEAFLATDNEIARDVFPEESGRTFDIGAGHAEEKLYQVGDFIAIPASGFRLTNHRFSLEVENDHGVGAFGLIFEGGGELGIEKLKAARR